MLGLGAQEESDGGQEGPSGCEAGSPWPVGPPGTLSHSPGLARTLVPTGSHRAQREGVFLGLGVLQATFPRPALAGRGLPSTCHPRL